MKTFQLAKKDSPARNIHIKYCDTFWSKLRGLMFVKELGQDEGILLAETAETKMNTSIHMFFMNFDIAVLWLDKNYSVVDKTLARKWRPYYAPKSPAQYVVEMHSSRLADFSIGDGLVLSPDAEDDNAG